jgi:hypothetical protein
MKRVLFGAAAIALIAGGAPAEPAKVADLGWMAGTWVQAGENGAVTRETWLPAQDGLAAGASVASRPGRKPFREFMTLHDAPEGPVFTAFIDGQPPTPFTLVSSDAGRFVFENKAHDFPQRVIYQRCGQDLCAAVEGEIDGKARTQTWRYTRER